MKNENKDLLQIRYYNGEEASHDIGIGMAPGNLIARCQEIEDRYIKNKIRDNLYHINRCTVESFETKSFSGDLGVRIIGSSLKDLENCTKNNKFPFCKEAVVPYNFSRESLK